jgi:transcriptional regulator with XRE-family HTH domain
VLQASNGRRTTFFDLNAFVLALDAERRNRGLSWRQVADETGISASTLSRMTQGKRPDVDGFAALTAWSGVDSNHFIRPSRRTRERPATLSAVSAAFHSDPHLSEEAARLLDDLVRTVYKRLRTSRAAKSVPH